MIRARGNADRDRRKTPDRSGGPHSAEPAANDGPEQAIGQAGLRLGRLDLTDCGMFLCADLHVAAALLIGVRTLEAVLAAELRTPQSDRLFVPPGDVGGLPMLAEVSGSASLAPIVEFPLRPEGATIRATGSTTRVL